MRHATVPLLTPPEQHWWCPNCTATAVTRKMPRAGEAAVQFHPCAGLAGLDAPMVPAGVKAKVVAMEREDYIGRELVTVDGNGRPVMSVITVRDDGTDCAVYAPCAVVTREEGSR